MNFLNFSWDFLFINACCKSLYIHFFFKKEQIYYPRQSVSQIASSKLKEEGVLLYPATQSTIHLNSSLLFFSLIFFNQLVFLISSFNIRFFLLSYHTFMTKIANLVG
jgi:hypothetical protein